VPYAVILIQAADRWRAENQGQLPSTFKQKDEFKAMVRKMNKYNGENFDEAINTAYDLWQIELPEALRDILNDDKANTSTDAFWLYVAALREFVKVYNRLPVSGTVPDMISTTNFYLQLQ
jgi:NEDD8-activating enzyme E1 regulatory subunit